MALVEADVLRDQAAASEQVDVVLLYSVFSL